MYSTNQKKVPFIFMIFSCLFLFHFYILQPKWEIQKISEIFCIWKNLKFWIFSRRLKKIWNLCRNKWKFTPEKSQKNTENRQFWTKLKNLVNIFRNLSLFLKWKILKETLWLVLYKGKGTKLKGGSLHPQRYPQLKTLDS